MLAGAITDWPDVDSTSPQSSDSDGTQAELFTALPPAEPATGAATDSTTESTEPAGTFAADSDSSSDVQSACQA